MSGIKLYSPDGMASVVPHPTKVQEMLDKGWTKERKPNKVDGIVKKDKPNN